MWARTTPAARIPGPEPRGTRPLPQAAAPVSGRAGGCPLTPHQPGRATGAWPVQGEGPVETDGETDKDRQGAGCGSEPRAGAIFSPRGPPFRAARARRPSSTPGGPRAPRRPALPRPPSVPRGDVKGRGPLGGPPLAVPRFPRGLRDAGPACCPLRPPRPGPGAGPPAGLRDRRDPPRVPPVSPSPGEAGSPG